MPRLYGLCTQGANDAFVQATIQTGLTGLTKTAYRVKQIGFDLVLPAVPYFPTNNVAVQDIEIALTRRSKTDVVTYADPDLIHKWRYGCAVFTGVGTPPYLECSQVWIPSGDPVLIVEDALYAQLDTTATSATWSTYVFIDYDVVTISELDRLSLLTQSLGS